MTLDALHRSTGRFLAIIKASERLSFAELREMDAAGVDIGVVVGRKTGFLGSVPNADVMEFVKLHPKRFIAVASVDLTGRKKAIREIDEAVTAGFKAINIEPGALDAPMSIDDRRLYPVYAHCEDRGLPVILLAGGNARPDLSATAPIANRPSPAPWSTGPT